MEKSEEYDIDHRTLSRSLSCGVFVPIRVPERIQYPRKAIEETFFISITRKSTEKSVPYVPKES